MLHDDPSVAALESVVSRSRGVWVCRRGEVEPTLPVRRRMLEPPAASLHDAGHAATVWPLYHDLGPGRYDPAWRLAYRAVNTAYAEAAAGEAAPGASVWIYGHTLQLVPAILRRRRPDVRIGFYLPTHFPSGDTFRALPMHREVLRGLLGADLLGFQTATAAENFLRRSHDATHRPPSVGVFPASVDSRAIRALTNSPAVERAAAELRRRLGDPRHVILSINAPEENQGTERRLLALGSAFRDGRLDPAETVMIQIVAGRTAGDATTDDAVARAAARVNGEHAAVGRPCIHYIVDTPGLADRVAYYRVADVLVATPLREASSTVALEFVAAARPEAALVLSELSGTAAVLPEAFLVNPHDDNGVRVGLTAALSVDCTARTARMARMREYVTEYHAYTWAESFLRTLRATLTQPDAAPTVGVADGASHLTRAPHRVRLGS
jgi:trehalose 6-phosphate synthase